MMLDSYLSARRAEGGCRARLLIRSEVTGASAWLDPTPSPTPQQGKSKPDAQARHTDFVAEASAQGGKIAMQHRGNHAAAWCRGEI